MTLSPEAASNIIRSRCSKILMTLDTKAKEYVRNDDRLHNFNRAAQMRNILREKALLGMMDKHTISILDMVDDLETGKLPTVAMVDEKIGDAINYLILLEMCFKQRIQTPVDSKKSDDTPIKATRYAMDIADARTYNIEDLKNVAIDKALEETGGNRRKAAELLGISERTVYRRAPKKRENNKHF